MSAQGTPTAQRSTILDPRTKLLVLASISTVLLTGGYDGALLVVRPILSLLPFVLLLMERKFVLAIGYASLVAFATALQYVITAYMPSLGLVTLLLLLMCGFALRLAPGIATGYYMVTTTTVNELVAGLERMHIPQTIVIPLAVMFRFVPTLLEEASAIGRAVRMRGTGNNRGLSFLEYRLVPLMMCSIRIGEELSASALTRGLGAPCKRTSISTIGFHLADGVVGAICIGCLAIFALQGFGGTL